MLNLPNFIEELVLRERLKSVIGFIIHFPLVQHKLGVQLTITLPAVLAPAAIALYAI